MECVVDKIKVELDNNNLETFKKAIIHVNGYVQFSFNGAGSYTIIHSDESENTYNYTAGQTKSVNEQGATVILNDKYTVTSINGATANFYFNIADFYYSPLSLIANANSNTFGDIAKLKHSNLTSVDFSGTHINGEIGELGEVTSLVTLKIYNLTSNLGLIKCNINSLKDCTSLETLNFLNSNPYGIVEQLVSEMVDSGRSSGTMTFEENSRDVYFNGMSSGGNHIFTINFTENGATVALTIGGVQQIGGTYNKTTGIWTYA